MRPPGLWTAHRGAGDRIPALARRPDARAELRRRMAAGDRADAGHAAGLQRLVFALALLPQPPFGFAVVQVLWSIRRLSLVVVGAVAAGASTCANPPPARPTTTGGACETHPEGYRGQRPHHHPPCADDGRRDGGDGGRPGRADALSAGRPGRRIQALLAEENRINIRLIPPRRGLIHDRNGKLIAENEQNYRVVITREDAGDVDLVMRRLANADPDDGRRAGRDGGGGEEALGLRAGHRQGPAQLGGFLEGRDQRPRPARRDARGRPVAAVSARHRLSPMWWAMSGRSAKRTWRRWKTPIRCCACPSSRSARSASRSGWRTPCAAPPAPRRSR
jgi:hypothetical protein